MLALNRIPVYVEINSNVYSILGVTSGTITEIKALRIYGSNDSIKGLLQDFPLNSKQKKRVHAVIHPFVLVFLHYLITNFLIIFCVFPVSLRVYKPLGKFSISKLKLLNPESVL